MGISIESIQLYNLPIPTFCFIKKFVFLKKWVTILAKLNKRKAVCIVLLIFLTYSKTDNTFIQLEIT